MRRTHRSAAFTTGLAATLALALCGLTACGLARADEARDDHRVTGEVSSVRIDSAAGAVTLRGDRATTSVRVQRALRYQGDRPEGATHRVEAGVLTLSGCGRECSVAYTVDLPAGLPVSGRTGSGRITLANVGAVDVATTDGAVQVTGATGKVVVRTGDGRVKGRDLHGDGISVRTGDGAVDVIPATAQDITATTANGSIIVSAPPAAYRIAADTAHGPKRVTLTDDPHGEYRLDLRTSHGAITVRPS
ncbi:DUF4097 family beta strand repeat-containing protein [Streptomyces sp. NPDC058374]|uniref:DUF4097 family beta strand repeat-containing protein n=1 Tax=Streptomyces sp. NPDC058374 TaxID=3346466 RepID=UPI0036620770